MDNKIVSILLKVLMGAMFLIGIILIGKNISIDTSVDPLEGQYYTQEFTVKGENGAADVTETVVNYDFVVDDSKGVVYDLSNEKVYELSAFLESNGKEKVATDKVSYSEIDTYFVNNRELQSATDNSVTFAYYLMIGGLILIAAFSVFHIITNPKRFMRSAIGVAILGVLTFIVYKASDKVGQGKITTFDGYSDSAYHMSAFGINLFLILTVLAAVLILIGSLFNILRFFNK